MNEEIATKELKKFNVTDAAIAKMDADYMALTVRDATDDNGYKAVKSARMEVVRLRGKVEKTRVILKADSLEYGRRIDREAKRITALLAPIEAHLIGQEKIIDDEKARIKAETEAKEAALLQIRINTLCAFGAMFNGQMYTVFGLQLPAALVKVCTDEQFDLFVAQLQKKKDEEDAKIKAFETARQVESDRLAKIAAEQEAERMRLAEIARKQEEESSRLQAEQKKIADAKQKVLDDAKRAKELEKASKIAAKKKEARCPDKKKLLDLARMEYVFPFMKTAEGLAIIETFKNGLAKLVAELREAAESL